MYTTVVEVYYLPERQWLVLGAPASATFPFFGRFAAVRPFRLTTHPDRFMARHAVDRRGYFEELARIQDRLDTLARDLSRKATYLHNSLPPRSPKTARAREAIADELEATQQEHGKVELEKWNVSVAITSLHRQMSEESEEGDAIPRHSLRSR